MKELPKELTKELLSDVFGKVVKSFKIYEKHNGIEYLTENGISVQNLDTLTRLCKEWIQEKKYQIKITISDGAYFIEIGKAYYNFNDKYFGNYTTELEAVLKAVQWVRDNK